MNSSFEKSPAARKVRELEETADTGASPWTPVILIADVWVVCAVAVLVLLAVTLLAVGLAT